MFISSHAQFKIYVNQLSSVYLKCKTPDTLQVQVCIRRASTPPITPHASCYLGVHFWQVAKFVRVHFWQLAKNVRFFKDTLSYCTNLATCQKCTRTNQATCQKCTYKFGSCQNLLQILKPVLILATPKFVRTNLATCQKCTCTNLRVAKIKQGFKIVC